MCSEDWGQIVKDFANQAEEFGSDPRSEGEISQVTKSIRAFKIGFVDHLPRAYSGFHLSLMVLGSREFL
jgi:hypothetical protein